MPSKPPGAKGKKPAAPRTKSARLAGFRKREVEFLAVALLAGTVTFLYPVTLPSSPCRRKRVTVRVCVGAMAYKALWSMGQSQRQNEQVSTNSRSPMPSRKPPAPRGACNYRRTAVVYSAIRPRKLSTATSTLPRARPLLSWRHGASVASDTGRRGSRRWSRRHLCEACLMFHPCSVAFRCCLLVLVLVLVFVCVCFG